MSPRFALAPLSVLLFAACSHAPSPSVRSAAPAPAAAGRSASPITTEELRRDLFAFAADSFRGRETGTADAQRAAAFLARRVQLLGLEPGGDSLYMQRVPLVREAIARGTRFTVGVNGQTKALRLGADVAPVVSFGDELPEPRRNADGDIVFIGYGAADDEEAEALAHVDLEGKVVVVLHGAPAGVTPDRKTLLESQEALGRRLGYLYRLHPAAMVFLMTPGTAEFYRQIMPELLRGVIPDGQEEAMSDAARPMPMVLFGLARAGSPLLPAKWPNDVRTQELGRRFTGHIEIQRDAFTGYNVVAVVRGRDPRLNKTYLAYGAHYDHTGIVRADSRGNDGTPPSDSIANGADDDGSGTVALLAIAKQMAAVRPKRSVLFVWHVAEEKGMLGSAYFTDHPTVPIDSIVAQFNADMIGRNDANTLALVGPRAAPNYQSWRLGMIVDSVNRAYPTPFRIDRQWDDPDHPEHIYQRSDHYNYAKKGIPIIFFTTGLHADYHKVTDDAAKIDYDKLSRVARLMFDAGLAVANRTSRPTSDAVPRVSSLSR